MSLSRFVSNTFKRPPGTLARIIYPNLSFLKFSNENDKTAGEKHIEDVLKRNLKVEGVLVQDISGGCGSMYEVHVSSEEFRGKRTLQQHKMITEILKNEVEQMHGLRIHTSVPEEN